MAILNPVGSDAWDIIEVKSSTEVKDVNLRDLAFQALVYSGAGLSIRRCCLVHVDRKRVAWLSLKGDAPVRA